MTVVFVGRSRYDEFACNSHHFFGRIPVPLMPPATFAGPPTTPGAVPGRVIPVPLIPPPCADSAGAAERPPVGGPPAGPFFAAPTGARGHDPTVPGRAPPGPIMGEMMPAGAVAAPI